MESVSSEFKRRVIEYITFEINSNSYSPDCLESLDVAKQCLETAWNISNTNSSDHLFTIFSERKSQNVINRNLNVTEEDKKTAEKLKSQGNICMGENLYNEAVKCYSEAIDADPYNAVYYCNRAAAFTKMNKNESAIEDCLKALEIDNKYSKAYSRMGLAYSAMRNFDEAITCYKKALDIEPDNQHYSQNLLAAEEQKKLLDSGNDQGASSAAGGLGNIPDLAGMLRGEGGGANFQNLLNNVDINNMLNNPQMMRLAEDFMTRPELRNMMGQIVQQMVGRQNVDEGGIQNDGDNRTAPNMSQFMNIGQQFAQQMQASNPELVETLRQRHAQQFAGGNTASDTSNTDAATTGRDGSSNEQKNTETTDGDNKSK